MPPFQITPYTSEWLQRLHILRDKQDGLVLKSLQPMLAPWPDLTAHLLDTPAHIDSVYRQWRYVLEEHVRARHFVRYSEDLESNGNGLLMSPTHKYFVTTDALRLPAVITLGAPVKNTEYRLCTPAWNLVSVAYTQAAHDLFAGVHSRDLAKLSFWGWVGQHPSEHISQVLRWKPRFYGGPAGSPAWGLHQALENQSQGSAKARSEMLYWMLDVTDSLHEQLSRLKTPLKWLPEHELSIKAYIHSWSAVVRIGTQYKRSASQVNDLLGYSSAIQKLLNIRECPQRAMYKKTVDYTQLLLSKKPNTCASPPTLD